MEEKVKAARDATEKRAWDNLGKYKFSNLGYWAAAWVKYNELLRGTASHSKSNPFRDIVLLARDKCKEFEN